jgi:hypothetical protein
LTLLIDRVSIDHASVAGRRQHPRKSGYSPTPIIDAFRNIATAALAAVFSQRGDHAKDAPSA